MKKLIACLALFCMSAGIYQNAVAQNGKSSGKQQKQRTKKKDIPGISSKGYGIVWNGLSGLAIDFVTPASGIPADFRSKIEWWLKEFGMKIPPEALINKQLHSFADTDKNRLDRLVRAINNPNSDVVWAMRGGFGSYKLIKALKDLPKPKKKKYFVGYSDITALNLFISQNWEDWTVIHGPVFREIAFDEFNFFDWTRLLYILRGENKPYTITGLHPLNKKTSAKLQGKLTGGNLSLIEASLGTCWEIQTRGKILFLEDCGESGPSIYRSLYHLKEVGKFDGVVAIVFGHFKGCVNFVENLKAFAEEIDIPVFMTDQFGHGKHNMPIVYNALGSIEGDVLKVNLEK